MNPEELAGRELRRLREARRWSQELVAERMGVYGYDWHQTMVAKTEAAQRPLRLNEVADMCDLFGVTLAELFTLVPEASAANLEGLAAARAARAESKLARIREVLGEDD